MLIGQLYDMCKESRYERHKRLKTIVKKQNTLKGGNQKVAEATRKEYPAT